MKKLKRLLGIKRLEVVSNKAGFTLIELIVVIAIMGIATSAIFSMNLFGYKTFAFGQNIAQKQFETRMAADFITKQLRYASSVTFLTSIPTPTAGTYDIYLNGGSIVFNNNGVKTTPPGLNNVSDFTLTFPTATNNVLNYTVGKTVNTNYNITSQVTVLNSLSFTHPSAPIGLRYTYNTTTPQYADLVNVFEKNVINVIGDSSTPFKMTTTLNTSNDSSHGILIQAPSVSFGSGSNIHCNLAIGASTINMSGVSQDTGDAVFDVSTIDNFGNVHGAGNGIYAYLPSSLISKFDKTKDIITYPQNGNGFWSSLFAKTGDNHIKIFALRTLKPNIVFSSINPKNLKIHYFDGNTTNVINLSQGFPDGSSINKDSYEYIICHGDLNIIGGNNCNAFNFQGLIYCDGNVNVYNVGDQFVLNGIIISKGITNNNVQKWNGITFNDNTINGVNLSDINTILNIITQ